MKCKVCGMELSANQTFCPQCGTKNEPEGNEKNTKKCINCGKEFTEDKIFCNTCGGNLVPIQQGNMQNTAASNQEAPRQMPPYQMPGQVPPGPMPGQTPYGQNPQNQGYPNMQAPNQGAPRQMPPYQMQGQVPPGPMPGQFPPGQVPPNMLPPLNPQMQAAPKKKNVLLPIFIIVGVVLVLLIGTIIVLKLVNDKASEDTTWQTPTDAPADNDQDLLPDDTAESTPTAAPSNNGSDNTGSDAAFTSTYGYTELPDVASLDSYSCFSYYDYNSADGVATYTYLYNDIAGSQSEYADILDGYEAVLEDTYGYYYEADFSQSQFYDTGDYSDYYSKDDMCIGITADIQDAGMYAYVNIYDLDAMGISDDANTDTSNDSNTDTDTDTDSGTTTDTSSYPNYYGYIDGRDTSDFEQYAEVYMENGIAFYLNDITMTDQGDGTAVVECNMDLAATIDNCSVYTDDFMVMPMDADGNIISDAVMMDSIKDGNGTYLDFPALLDTQYFYSYTVTFTVPSNTDSMTFYGLNIELDPDTNDSVSSGSVYYIDISFE